MEVHSVSSRTTSDGEVIGEVTGSGDQARPGEKVVFGDGTCASTGMSRVRTHKVERPESSREVDSVPAVNMLSSFSDSLSCLYCTCRLACTVSGCVCRCAWWRVARVEGGKRYLCHETPESRLVGSHGAFCWIASARQSLAQQCECRAERERETSNSAE